jgi:DNA replication and repair protein RecF
VLRFSAVFSEQDIRAQMIEMFAKDIADQFTIEPHYGGTLFKQGTELVALRRQTLEALAPAFARVTAAFRLGEGRLSYIGEPPTHDELVATLARDVERGTTGAGPHLHDVVVAAGDRDLRFFGSQGEQRLAVLALLLAEAEALGGRDDPTPLLLLDDVLSELDVERRRTLAQLLPQRGQALITSTSVETLPVTPAQLLTISPGEVRAA